MGRATDNGAEFWYLAGFLCKVGDSGEVKREAAIVVESVIEYEYYQENSMRIRRSKKRFISIDNWENPKRQEALGVAGFYLGEGGEVESGFSEEDLPLFIGSRREYKVYKEGKLQVFAYSALFRNLSVIVYADSAGELKLLFGVPFSKFRVEHRGQYILNQVYGIRGEQLESLEESAVELDSDDDYKIATARNRITAADCTVTDLRGGGLTVTEVLASVSGVCRVNSKVREFSPKNKITGKLLKVLDLSECKELQSADVSIEDADNMTVLFSSTKLGWFNISILKTKKVSFINLKDFGMFFALDCEITGFPSRFSFRELDLRNCTGVKVLEHIVTHSSPANVQIVACDTERLSLTVNSLSGVIIADCEKLEEVSISVDRLSPFDLDKIICNCRKLKRVSIKAKTLWFRDAREKGVYEGDSARLNDIMTASFGSTCLKEFSLTVEEVDSELDSKLNRGFIIAVPSDVDFKCSENVRKYFIGVRFNDEMRELLCALPSISLTYVDDKITLGFDSRRGNVSRVNGFHNSKLFVENSLIIPREIERIQESSVAFDSFFKVHKLVIKSPLEVGKKAFLGADIEEIAGSEWLTKVEEAAFARNSNLKGVELGDKARVSTFAFGECSSLTSVTGVVLAKSIKPSAFAACDMVSEASKQALGERGVYTDMLTLTHRLSDSEFLKLGSFTSYRTHLRLIQCVYVREFVRRGITKEAVSSLMDKVKGKGDYKNLHELYSAHEKIAKACHTGNLSASTDYGVYEHTIYKFRKEFGIEVQGYE